MIIKNEISFALMGCMEEDDVNAIPCNCPFRVRLFKNDPGHFF